MHTKQRAAFRASPLGGFLGEKTFHPDDLDALQIGDDAYAVFGLVAFFQTLQVSAWKFVAERTELKSPGSKLPDGAGDARIRFVLIHTAATRARLTLANVGTAQAAIDATRRNDGRITCSDLHDFRHHASLSDSAQYCSPLFFQQAT